MLTIGIMRHIFPSVEPARLQIFTQWMDKYCQQYEINTHKRMAAFFAQIGHESGDLRWTAEIWGPTPQQRRYEPPSDLAQRLGNTTPGDGSRFCGRGLIQITGRSNYEQVSKALGIDFIATPEILQHPDHAVHSACWWWSNRGLNEWADKNDDHAFRRITIIINGGMNGWEDRFARWRRLKKIFAME